MIYTTILKPKYKNLFRGEVKKGKKHLEMCLKEFELMKFIVRHEGEVISRNQLLDEVRGYNVYPSTRTVDDYILIVRKNLRVIRLSRNIYSQYMLPDINLQNDRILIVYEVLQFFDKCFTKQ